jgi:hypothetical protein
LSSVAAGSAQEIAVVTFRSIAAGNAVFGGRVARALDSSLNNIGVVGRVFVSGKCNMTINSSRRSADETSALQVIPPFESLLRLYSVSRRACATYPLGDTNLDCAFDIADVLFLQQYVLAKASTFSGTPQYANLADAQLRMLDADQNGVANDASKTVAINNADVVFLNRALFQQLRFVAIPTLVAVENPASKCKLTISVQVSQNPSYFVGNGIALAANTFIFFDVRSANASFQSEFDSTFGSSIVAGTSNTPGAYGGLVRATHIWVRRLSSKRFLKY